MTNPLLHYKSFGEETKQTVILLHGMLGSMDNWRSQARQLANHFRVITPDLRNHGRSPHLRGMRYQDMANDVLDLADHLGIDRFDLLGHSMGGKIAMEVALQQPEKIQHLIIIDIVPKSYNLWHLTTFKALLALPVSNLSSRQQADEILSNQITDPFERAFLLKNLKPNKTGGYSWRCNLKEITRAYLNIANFTPPPQSQFVGKTLFVKGEQSPYIDINTDPAVIAELFPKATLQTVNEAGHTPHIEKAQAFYVVISEFLATPETH